MTPGPNELKVALQRLIDGTASEADRDVVRTALNTGALVTGEGAVAIGRDASDVIVTTGDQNIVFSFKGADAATVLTAISQATGQPKPHPIRGLLIPANDPSPLSPYPIPDLYKAIYFGDGVATVNPARNAFTLIKIAGEDVLSFENTASGILINAVFRDEAGKEIATITKNVFRATSTSDYEATSPDQHSLLILDGQDRQVLYVRYLNPKAIKVLGVFYHPKGRSPLLIEENGLTINGRKMHGLYSNELGIWAGQSAIVYE